MEEYKLIKDYPNYEVSNFGNVRNIKTGQVLKKCVNKCGYHIVCLKCRSRVVHRLVALTFLDNPDNKLQVDHIDNNKQNNHVQNLRWCTNAENQRNVSISKNNTSGIKGISWDKRSNKWLVEIRYNYKGIHIGRFSNLEDAKQARINKANELFGEFTNKREKIQINIKQLLLDATVIIEKANDIIIEHKIRQ